MPQTFNGLQKVHTLEGDTVQVATGPVSSVIAIKQLGTNGGGFFGPNSTHPFENPNYFTNIISNFSIFLFLHASCLHSVFILTGKSLPGFSFS